MDHIHYEILSTATGQPTAQSIRSLVGRTEPSAAHVDLLVARELALTSDPDMATALIVAELLRAPGSAP